MRTSDEHARRPGVSALFGVASPSAIVERGWPDELLHARGPIGRLRGLVDYDLADLVQMDRAFTKAFVWSEDGRATSHPIAAGRVLALYDAGHTVYFHGLRAPAIAEWIEALEDELGLVRGATTVSAFALRKGPGLAAHFDRTANIVCQAKGTKRWTLAPNEHVRSPTVGHFLGARKSRALEEQAPGPFPTTMPEPRRTIDLEPGSVLFVPRGMWHKAEAQREPSLHFAFQIEPEAFRAWRRAV